MTEQKPSFWVHFLAGGVGGTVGAAITCPLEVVKTRLQSSLYKQQQVSASFTRNPLSAVYQHMSGVVDILRTIKRQEGIRALWKGMGPNLVGVVPARSIYFSVYSQGKHTYSELLNNGNESSLVHMVSAFTAGLCVASFTSPIWLVKTRMQLQSEAVNLGNVPKYRNSLHCAYEVIKHEGIRGLYVGFSASVIGLSESTLQFVTYEYMKKLRKNQLEKQGKVPELSAFDTFVLAAGAKLGAAMLTYPHEVVRTRMRQTPIDGVRKYVGFVQTAKLIYKEEGMIALYGGMTAHLMRVVPNAAILFFCYELVVRYWE
ncbi:mitochondrial carrier domain-containing protein [Gorgonomyces haynaldii]|nr:mitochondrial carrier domain-containing protein [Gorgonomyces haynaldii]